MCMNLHTGQAWLTLYRVASEFGVEGFLLLSHILVAVLLAPHYHQKKERVRLAFMVWVVTLPNAPVASIISRLPHHWEIPR